MGRLSGSGDGRRHGENRERENYPQSGHQITINATSTRRAMRWGFLWLAVRNQIVVGYLARNAVMTTTVGCLITGRMLLGRRDIGSSVSRRGLSGLITNGYVPAVRCAPKTAVVAMY